MDGDAAARRAETSGWRGVRLLRPHSKWLAAITAALIVLAMADMAVPYFLKLLIDEVFPMGGAEGGGNWGLLWFILPGIGGIYVLRNVLYYFWRMRALRMSEDVCFDLRKRLFEHLQKLSIRFYRSHQPGKISARLMDDTFKIQSFIQDKLPNLVRYLLEFQVLVVIIYLVNWRLALASSIVLPLHYWTYRRFRGPIRSSHSEAQENLATAHGNVVEQFLGIEVVKGFSAEERESRTFHEAIHASKESEIRSQRFHFRQKVMADLLVGVGTVMLLGYGAWEVRSGRMTGGSFLMFFWYVKMLYPAVLEVISGVGHLSRALASVDRVHEMLEEPADEASMSRTDGGAIELAGKIELQDVSFRYEETDSQPVLSHVSVVIEPGERVAITGPSGSGKSTLVSLFPRFNHPTSGRVLIDDQPADELPIRPLRNLFGIVFQEVFLFNASIYENIRYARPSATLEEVVEACRITGAHRFIQRLPDGYYTTVGETGGELSRGEKQRITLARALVKNPRVLVLDEATASIDSSGATEILESMIKRMRGRTVVMVTHDTELLHLVDRVISIDEGRVVYDGSPEEIPAELAARMNIPASPILEAKPGAGRRVWPRSSERTGNGFSGGGSGKSAGAGSSSRSGSFGPVMKEEGGADAAPGQRKADRTSTGGKGGGGSSAVGLLLAMGMTAALLLGNGGCHRSTKTERSISMEEPRISEGLFIEEDDEADLEQLVKALDDLTLDPSGLSADGVDANQLGRRLGGDRAMTSAADAGADAVAVQDDGEAWLPSGLAKSQSGVELGGVGLDAAPVAAPAGAVKLIELPEMSDVELSELIERTTLRLNVDHGYVRDGGGTLAALPVPPDRFREVAQVMRAEESGTHVMRFAFRRFMSQPPQLWVLGVKVDEAGDLSSSGDVEAVQPLVTELVTDLDAMRANLAVEELEAKLIQLSYIDAPNALSLLDGMGVTTLNAPNAVPEPPVFDALPYVVSIPDPKPENIGLIGQSGLASGEFGLSLTPSVASQLASETIASPMTQLMVLFHPAHPEQFSRVRMLIDKYIDRPARQIFIEGMVLEISEEGLKDLGIEWELNEGPISWRVGSLNQGVGDTANLEFDDLDFWRVFTRSFEWNWTLKIRTLIRDGKAEILSRPSVLTMNNRQSTIRVGQDIPIATSTEGTSGFSNKVAFNFKYLATGILLNIRPRINEQGSEVSMLIDTVVSSRVPNADLEIRSTEGEILASAPTVSTRRVQTYGRIRNNTPFIIGGLVARERSTVQDKVPLLGDLPLVGAAFRSERQESSKREVIIVLTPYVLPEESVVSRGLPGDDDRFDSFGNELFRDSYRIRAEDVFDLRFLFENRRLNRYRELASELMERNFRLAEHEPFKSFAGGRVPGEQILVVRMVYEVIKRLETGELVEPARIIFFEQQHMGGTGYDVRFFERTLAMLGGGTESGAFFRNMDGKALAMTYFYDRESEAAGRLATEPIPELRVYQCADRQAWAELLWRLNQPDAQGRQRYSVLIQTPEDVTRLRRALALKRIVTLNGGEGELSLRNFSIGKLLLIPDFKEGQVHVIDAEVARYFFQTEHYYAALIQRIEDRLTQLDAILRGPAGGLDADGPGTDLNGLMVPLDTSELLEPFEGELE